MKGKELSRALGMLIMISLLVVSYACKQPFSLTELIDGPDGRQLLVTPESAQVQIRGSLAIETSGGLPPYTFTVTDGNSCGSMNGNVFTASETTGTVTIEVRDKAGASRVIMLVVISVDYEASMIEGLSFSLPLAGSAFTAEFSIRNNGSTPGSKTISWDVYASTDTALSVLDDRIVASGSLAGLAAGATIVVPITGTWPSVAGNYYLLVDVDAADDLIPGNNLNESDLATAIHTGLGISPVTASIYTGQTVPFIVSGGTGNYHFSFMQNQSGAASVSNSVHTAGSSAGTDIIVVQDTTCPGLPTATATIVVQQKPLSIIPPSATVYINQSLDFNSVGGDGTFSFTLTGDSGGTINQATGLYTAGSMTGIDFITLTDAYDARTQTATVIVVDIQTSVDYEVQAVDGLEFALPLAGSAFTAVFSIKNIGTAPGSKTINWVVYSSEDEVIGGSGDKMVDSGSLAGFTAGETKPVSIAGTWPAEAGNYYLLVDVVATDDLTLGNNRNQSDTATSVYTALGINPVIATVYTGQPVGFSVSGGTGIYQYSFTQKQSDTAVIAGDVYTAGRFAGTDTIVVQDLTHAGLPTATATISVQAKNLSISPDNATIYVYQPLDFNPVGGDGAFSFALTGGYGGTIDTATGLYIAGSTPGIDTITMTDAYDGRTRTATVTVVDIQTSVDYEAQEVTGPGDTLPLVGSAFTASLSIKNVGTAPGTKTLNWVVYASSDATISVLDDRVVAFGSRGGILAGDTVIVPVSGTWPSEPGIYYLLVKVDAVDDLNPDNNWKESALATSIYRGLSISPTTASIYTGQSISFSVHGGTGSYAYTINPNQSGAAAVSADVYAAGASAGTDTIVVQDTTLPGLPSATATITVTSPPVSPPATVVDVDYYVSTPPTGGLSAEVDETLSASFRITNQGSDDGSATIYWTAYISSDPVYNAGDEFVAMGSLSPLGAAEVSSVISIPGFTSAVAGNWYLLVRVQASDELSINNNIRASSNVYPFTYPSPIEPDYKPGNISMYWPYVTSGSQVQEKFSLTNIGFAGTDNVTWTAYASLDTVLGIGDLTLGSGVVGPLVNGQTMADTPLLGVSWPLAQGDFYLIVSATAGDENVSSQNDYAVSAGTFTLSEPPDYAIQAVTYPVSAEAGTAASGGFTIKNTGSGDGSKIVTWEVFLSFDMGHTQDDLLIGSGDFGSLPSGGSMQIQASELSISNWPNYGLCYVLIRIQAIDDGNGANNNYASGATELYVFDIEGPVVDRMLNNGTGVSAVPIVPAQNAGPLRLGQTLVVRGWLDSKLGGKGWDTYSFSLGPSVTQVSTYASWLAAANICNLYIWNENSLEVISTDNVSYREPSSGYKTVSGWAALAVGYVGIDSQLNPAIGSEYPYTLYIKGE